MKKNRCYSSILLLFLIGYLGYKDIVMKEKLVIVENDLEISTASTNDLPSPFCVRDNKGKFVDYNIAFKKLVFDRAGVKGSMKGKHPQNIFGGSSRQYDYNDSLVRLSPVPRRFVEVGFETIIKKDTVIQNVIDTVNGFEMLKIDTTIFLDTIVVPVPVEVLKWRIEKDGEIIGVGTLANYNFE